MLSLKKTTFSQKEEISVGAKTDYANRNTTKNRDNHQKRWLTRRCGGGGGGGDSESRNHDKQ